MSLISYSLQWRHNGRDSVSNHQPHDCFLNRLFRHISKKTSKLRVTGLCAGNSPEVGEFPAQMASNAENVSIGCHHTPWSIRVNGVTQVHLTRGKSSSINPLRAKFFRGNINIYLQFVSFILIDLTQVLKILPQVREGPTYSIQSISWLLMSCDVRSQNIRSHDVDLDKPR